MSCAVCVFDTGVFPTQAPLHRGGRDVTYYYNILCSTYVRQLTTPSSPRCDVSARILCGSEGSSSYFLLFSFMCCSAPHASRERGAGGECGRWKKEKSLFRGPYLFLIPTFLTPPPSLHPPAHLRLSLNPFELYEGRKERGKGGRKERSHRLIGILKGKN